MIYLVLLAQASCLCGVLVIAADPTVILWLLDSCFAQTPSNAARVLAYAKTTLDGIGSNRLESD